MRRARFCSRMSRSWQTPAGTGSNGLAGELRRHERSPRSARIGQRSSRWSSRRGATGAGPGAAGSTRGGGMTLDIPRGQYADLYGPTTGDRVRLADTELILEVEADFATYGDEITF